MITLTYPADWVTVAPIAETVKRHLWARVAEVYTALAHQRPCLDRLFSSLTQMMGSDVIYRASDQFRRDHQYWMKRFADRPDPVSLAGLPSAMPANFLHRRTSVLLSRVDRLQEAASRAGVRWPPHGGCRGGGLCPPADQ